MNAIKGFRGHHRWLSKFWPAEGVLDGMVFSTVQGAYQAAKSLNLEVRAQIAALPKPGLTKRYGRKLKVRDDWQEVKLAVMEDLLRQKLLGTGDAYLEESNTWGDCWWGVCDGKGVNHLGRLLMKIRNEMRG